MEQNTYEQIQNVNVKQPMKYRSQTDLDDSFLESFLSSLERGERERSRRELRDDLSRLRLLLFSGKEGKNKVNYPPDWNR